MANNNSDFNPSLIIFALFIVFASKGAAIVPLMIFYFFYKMFTSGGNNRKNQRDDRREYRERERGRQRDYRRRDTDFTRDSRTSNPPQRRERRVERTRQRPTRNVRKTRKDNPYKKSGMEKYKEYDYRGAIEDFEKALTIDDQDIATHFNIACAYSIMEEKEKSFFHLSKAVQLGYSDHEKIQTHDALAYLRIQDEFEGFVQNGYKLKNGSNNQEESLSLIHI